MANNSDSLPRNPEDIEKLSQEILQSEKRYKHLQLEEINAYKLANEISDKIWEIVSKWERFAKNTIGEQVVRSADSMGANVAEGYGRYFFKDNILFLYYSRGSTYETKFWIEKAFKRGFLQKEDFKEVRGKVEKFIIELNKLIKTMKSQVDKFLRVPWYRYKPKLYNQ